MRTPTGGLRPALVLLVLLALISLGGPGRATAGATPTRAGHVDAAAAITTKCHDTWNLKPGACGQRVADLQWLLAGHHPNVFTKTAPTFKWKPNGSYGARTKSAVTAYKFRIGYPRPGQCGSKADLVNTTVGPQFFAILEGKKTRSTCWVGLASKRIKGLPVAGATPAALAIKQLELSQLGVHETGAYNSNRGPCISTVCTLAGHAYGPYQGSTGAYGLEWCASFADWALAAVTGHGFGSSNDAYVPTIVEHAQALGQLQAKPRVGAFVAFLTAAGQLGSAYHIGFVSSLVGSSGIQTIEGNSTDPFGGGVHQVYRRFATYHMVYVYIPGVA